MAAKKKPTTRRERVAAVLSGNFLDEARKLYGSVVELYRDPELNQLFADAFINQWSVDEFIRRFDRTKWAQDRTTAQEGFDILEASKPEEAAARVETYRAQVQSTVGGLGLSLSDEQTAQIARMAARNNWTGQQFVSGVGAEAVRLVNTGGAQTPISAEEVRQVAKNYGVPVSDSVVSQWANEIASGTKTIEQWTQMQKSSAKTLYSAVADRLETETFSDITEPYRQFAASTLEVPADNLDLTQPKWARLFAAGEGGSQPSRLMNLTEWASYVRAQPEWQNTANAYREYSDMASRLENIFRGRG